MACNPHTLAAHPKNGCSSLSWLYTQPEPRLISMSEILKQMENLASSGKSMDHRWNANPTTLPLPALEKKDADGTSINLGHHSYKQIERRPTG